MAHGPFGEILGGHSEVRIENLEVPAEPAGRRNAAASPAASTARLWPPAPRHAQRGDGPAGARPCGAAHVTNRFDLRRNCPVAGRYSGCCRLRRRALHRPADAAAYRHKAEKGPRPPSGTASPRCFSPTWLHKVVDTAIQLHGALGYSTDTPLARWWHPYPLAASWSTGRTRHRWTTGRKLLKAYPENTARPLGRRRRPALAVAKDEGPADRLRRAFVIAAIVASGGDQDRPARGERGLQRRPVDRAVMFEVLELEHAQFLESDGCGR